MRFFFLDEFKGFIHGIKTIREAYPLFAHL